MAIVWPCPLPVDAYVAAGRKVEVPRPDCPSCGEALVFWSGYWRHVRAGGLAGGRCPKIFVPRVRCGLCRASHALLPAFVLAWRLDVAEAVGAVIGQVAGGACGVRPAAARAGVPHTTARGWVRRFGARAVVCGTPTWPAAGRTPHAPPATCPITAPTASARSSRQASTNAGSSAWLTRHGPHRTLGTKIFGHRPAARTCRQ